MIYNQYESDVKARLLRTVGTVRQDAWPPPDLTSNPARHVFSQLAGLYRRVPEVMPPDGGELVAAAVVDSGYWQLAQRMQRDTLAFNETLIHVTLVDGAPVFRLVWADMVGVDVNPRNPALITAVREWRPDPDLDGRYVLYVTEPSTRTYVALDENGHDVSERVLGGQFSGEEYPWVVAGAPVLPYVKYSSAETGYAWDPFSGAEVYDGSLQLAVYYTMLAHVMADSSWAQRYALGAELVGGDITPNGERHEVVTDPATLLLLRQADDSTGQPTVGQWDAPIDPAVFISTIERYERRVVEMALGTVGVSRRESDVRSAASLAVSREAQREAQRAFEPLFRRVDLLLLSLVSGLMGGPVDGWRITYKSLPKDPVELAAEMDQLTKQIDAGLMDTATAYQQLHQGISRAEAETAVASIAAGSGPPE